MLITEAGTVSALCATPSYLAAAVSGMGVLLQPPEIVEPHTASGQLATLLPEYSDSAPTRPMHMVYVPDRRMTPKLRSFIEFVIANFGPDAHGSTERTMLKSA
ncbi:LysR substrate-binding domain-containing protein [Herminiimonas sp. CN]|uniref:LysR substrate-binding domain-containing protein n=1 Tax=Herminiimonas sp. CN TaxID=1349818 RepID=UPI0012DC77AA|nr:LysR substrate-binding domain-containing protein [Herminiimonas sp. CN]